ncbi:MAG: universal stress protein [Acetobacter sp.]|uniref:universal stress protein n=1 Tax=Acetobacter sp. TaxID=440 RepID=UPI0039E7899A
MQRCLVILGRVEQAHGLLDMAAQVMARVGGARMDVLAAREPADGQPDRGVRDSQLQWADSLHTVFRQWKERAYGAGTWRPDQIEVNWLDPEITVDRIVSGYGKDADLLVLGFPDPRDSAQKQAATRAAIFDTGRPVLFVPPFWERPSGDHIFLAWKDTPGCRRAFTAARSFMGFAKSVTVVVPVGVTLPLDVLPGVSPTVRELPPTDNATQAGRTILDMAHAAQADMLVIGGYEHGALYNRLMGSVTDEILSQPDMPVLLQH